MVVSEKYQLYKRGTLTQPITALLHSLGCVRRKDTRCSLLRLRITNKEYPTPNFLSHSLKIFNKKKPQEEKKIVARFINQLIPIATINRWFYHSFTFLCLFLDAVYPLDPWLHELFWPCCLCPFAKWDFSLMTVFSSIPTRGSRWQQSSSIPSGHYSCLGLWVVLH